MKFKKITKEGIFLRNWSHCVSGFRVQKTYQRSCLYLLSKFDKLFFIAELDFEKWNNYSIRHPEIHKKGTIVLIFLVQLQTETKKKTMPTIQSTRISSAIHVLVVQFKCLIQWNKLRNFRLVLLVRVTKKAKVEKGGGWAGAEGCLFSFPCIEPSPFRKIYFLKKKGVTTRHTSYMRCMSLSVGSRFPQGRPQTVNFSSFPVCY